MLSQACASDLACQPCSNLQRALVSLQGCQMCLSSTSMAALDESRSAVPP